MALLDKVVCPHCKKLTLKGRYCMNCGRELPEVLEAQPQTSASRPEEQGIRQGEEQQASTPLSEHVTSEDVTEERKLVEQLSKLYSWSLRLLDLFMDNEASLDVFTEIYQEYSSRIGTLDEKRREMMKRYEERIKELTERSDSLKVRHEVGEVGDREYIRQKIELDKELSRLRPKLGILQNPIEIRLADIPSFTENLNRKMTEIKEKGEKLGLTQEQISKIVDDLKGLLDATQVMVVQHKKIKHEIQKLEIRYKIGELKQDEYLAQKQRLERQLELTF